jgi:hypothetical protein
MVVLANTDEEGNWLRIAARDWAREDGFALRAPHYTVSSAGLSKRPSSEVDLAVGGILLLDQYADFDDHGLYNLGKRVTGESLPVVVIGIDTLEAHVEEDPDAYMKRLRDKAETLGLSVITMEDLEESAVTPGVDVRDALSKINRHRGSMGMRPLDPVATGWTDQDVLLEAKRIERLSNPLLDLKRTLLQTRRPNPGYASQQYPIFPVTKWNQTYVFPLTENDDALLRRVARDERWTLRRVGGIGAHKFIRTGYHLSSPDRHRDPVNSLVEVHDWRGWWAEPVVGDEGIQFWNFIETDQTDLALEKDLGRLFVGSYANPDDDQVALLEKNQAEIEGVAGMRAVVVSNRKDRNLEGALKRELGLDAVVVDAAGRPRRIRSIADSIVSRSCDLVIAVVGFLPHKDDNVLARAARKAGVPYVRARKSSLSSIARAIERDLGLGRAANPERWLAPKLSAAQRARLKQLHDVYFDLFHEVESLPDATLTTQTGEYTVPDGYALVYRVGGVDYVFFQDEAPAETWSFVTVGRGGENDRVEHLEDYLAVLERINDAVIRYVRGENPSDLVGRLIRT